jgi:type I restriction enzyme R subunit
MTPEALLRANYLKLEAEMTGTSQLRFFDPLADFAIAGGCRLPHSAQSGTVTFITWRTWDSIPSVVLEKWLATRAEWLLTHGIDVHQSGWEERLIDLPACELKEYRDLVSTRWEESLDGGLGACPFRNPALAGIVADAFRHFDGDRYRLFDFVVMPNHVHLLVAFEPTGGMRSQCESWKRFTATRLNRRLQRTGRFWAADAFDHLVRSAEQFQRLRWYIADNPVRARLADNEYIHYSAARDGEPTRTSADGD